MIRYKDISIPNPCAVDYDSLPYDDLKRFCGSCQKHVYDFRDKDEIYLNEVFQKTGNVCGVYYEDQIKSNSLKIERPFYYAFATKIISIGLFIKMLLSSYDAEAEISNTFHTTQVSEDSINVKTIYKGKENGASLYDVNIDCYVNDTLIKSYNLSYHDTLQLAGNFLPDDKIKLIVSTRRRNITPHKRGEKPKASYYSTKSKIYNFRFKKIHTVIVKINYNKKIFLSHKKRNAITGLICPSNFW